MKKFFNKIGNWWLGIFLGIAILLSCFSKDLSNKWIHWGSEKTFAVIEWVVNNRVERNLKKLEKINFNLQQSNSGQTVIVK